MLLRKYQKGETNFRPMGSALNYKPILSDKEISNINNNKYDNIFIGNAKECAGDACRNLAPAVTYANKPNIYALLENYEKKGVFNDLNKKYFDEGLTTSWHSAGVAKKMGADILYNARSQPEKELIPALNKVSVGSVVLLGSDNPLFQRDPNGYSKKAGFYPSNHTVMAYAFKENGEPLFMDGYDKKIYDLEGLNNRWGGKYKIQTIYTPQEYKDLNKDFMSDLYNKQNNVLANALSIDDNKEKPKEDKIYYNSPKYFSRLQESGKEFRADDMSKFIKALNKNAPDIAKDLYLDTEDYTRLANLSTAIALKETKGGKSLDGFFEKIAEAHGDSKGLTQIKLESLSPEVKNILSRKYNISTEYDLRENPENAAIATMYHLGELINQVNSSYNKGVDKSVEIESRWRGPKEIVKRVLRSNNPGWFVGGRTTEGNAPLSIEEKLLYGWGGLKRLSTGDAQGNNKYVKDVMKIYNDLFTNTLPEVSVKPQLLYKKK